jgi:hypothetical protein
MVDLAEASMKVLGLRMALSLQDRDDCLLFVLGVNLEDPGVDAARGSRLVLNALRSEV